MNALTDQQLLRDYAGNHSEVAFAELVRRHVDLVYSAALRMLCDSHQAEDVAQSVFVALAQHARQLTEHPVLSGWLHRTTQNLAANAVRTNVRRQMREQEAVVMNDLISGESDTNWEHIAPHLDVALGELSETDRDAILLRYFEKKSAPEMAEHLGISAEAAQKRVNRAVDRLRDLFAKRGVTVGASGLAVVLAANAVQAAPVGFALTVSTAAALTGTTLSTAAVAATTKAIAMTALQKTVAAATIAVLAGVGIYEARQASHLRDQVQAFQHQQAPLRDQIAELNQVLIDATNRLAALRDDNERLNQNSSELLKLRGEVRGLAGQQTSQQDHPLEQEQLESEWIKRIVYFGDDDQIKLWRSRGPDGIQMLVRALKSPAYDHSTRMCVASLISQLGNDARSAIPELISMIKTEKDESVRGILLGYFEGAIDALGETEKAEMFPELIRALQSSNGSVRNNALVLLQAYPSQSETVIPLIVQMLQDSSPGVRVMAVKALSKLDPQNSAGAEQVVVLVGCLNGPTGDTPSAANDAAIMLGKLHREPDLAVPALIQSLQSADRYVRQNSAVALGRFGQQAKPAITALTKALADSDSGVRSQAASAIASINSATSAE